MTTHRLRRQSATPVGFDKRLDAMGLSQVRDPRCAPWVVHRLDALLKLIIVSIASAAGSSRGAERRAQQLREQRRRALGVEGEVADNTISTLLPNLDTYELRQANVELIKREKRRGNLEPIDGLPFHVVAIDGKAIMTYRWHDLVRLTRKAWKALNARWDGWIEPPYQATGREPNVFEVYCCLSLTYPEIQLVCPSNSSPYGKIMVHRATLVSSRASVGLLERVIPGCTNEVGMLGSTLTSVFCDYGATDLCAMFVMDAGNTCLKAASQIALRSGYFMALKSNQPSLYRHAKQVLGDGELEVCRPDLEMREVRGGKEVIYRLWQHELPEGYGAWVHARQLVRVERVVVGHQDGDVSVGNRYYISSKGVDGVNAKMALKLSRMYWRCENEGHWTADAILMEDTLQGRLSRDPCGVAVASCLRMLAQNLLSILRALSRIDRQGTKPSWQEVIEYVLMVFCHPVLDVRGFNAVGV